MKRIIKMLSIMAVVVAVGCAGAPDPEPTPEPSPEPVPEATADPVETDLAAPNRATATELRSVVERNNFGPEAPELYAAAETAFNAAEESYDTAPERAVTLYDEASEGYRQVIDQGWRSRAAREREEVHAERDRARSVRAEVAQRERYDRAQADLNRAETLLEEEQYESAFESFGNARRGFNTAYTVAREQRERALRSLEQLDSDLVETASRLERMQQDMEMEDE